MSLETTTNRVSYAGNDVTTAFSFPYYFLANGDLVVILTDADGLETTQTITTHYTVSGAGVSAGGTVTMVTAPATGETLTIYRDAAITQGVDLRENDALPAENLEEALDRLTMIAQRLDDQLNRAVLKSDGFVDTFDLTLPSDLATANATVVVNATADGWDMGPTTTEIENAETNATAAAASASAASASATLASQWASLTSGQVAATDYSAKAWAIGGTGVTDTASAGAAKEWASNAYGDLVDTVEYSAKHYATVAAAAAQSAFFRDVAYITNADSPVTVSSTANGTIYVADTSGGAITVNLPGIASTGTPFNIAFKLATAGNDLTVSRNGTDTIDGATSKVLSAANTGFQLIADTDGSPDDWTSLEFGSVGDGTVTLAKLNSEVTPFLVPTGTVLDYSGSSAPTGYVLASGATIGNASSGATERANADTEDLFTLYWTDYSDTLLPIYDSGGGASTRGASAAADFAANKRLSIPDLRGRTVAGLDNMGGSAASRLTSTALTPDGDTLGAAGGAQTHTLTAAELAAHSHTSGTIAVSSSSGTHSHSITVTSGPAGSPNRVREGLNTNSGTYTTPTAGGHTHTSPAISGSVANNSPAGSAHNNTQPTFVMNKIIKL